jgi:hypothetical protein
MSQAFEFPVDNLHLKLEHLLIRKAVGVEIFPLTSVKTNCVCVCVRARICGNVSGTIINKLAKMEILMWEIIGNGRLKFCLQTNTRVQRLISFICDKSATTKNLAFLSYWYRKKR